MADTGKIAEVLFENALDTYEDQMQLVDLTTVFTPNAGDMQNSGNFVWRPTQQHAPILDGWDLTGQETGIIEETYPAILGTPKNDFVEQRADDLRDTMFWERRGKQSGLQQATELNKNIATLVKNTGSLFYRSNTASGYNFIAEGQALQNERQSAVDTRCFVLNDRDQLKFSSDLAGRQTLQGRPETAWATGQIGQNVAEYDLYTGSYLPNLAGGADPATTVTADQSFKPEGGSVDAATGVVTNVDYRLATIAVAASASYNIGDKVSFANGGTTVKAVGLADKSDTDQAMTFTIVAKPSGTSVQVYPKPIALDDPALSVLEQAYANVDTRILNTATMNRLNIDASAKSNLFWSKDSIEVFAGSIPADLFSQFAGKKVVSSTLKSGLQMYMVYDGKIDDMTFRFRLFTWYGLTNCNPMANGVAVTF
tara:strand:+ start:4607 stop:5881 length:1275 start_codon:yes stop_codon:yes gene_type:complete